MHDNTRRLFGSYAAKFFTADSIVLEIGAIHPNPWGVYCARWDTTDIVANPRNTFTCQPLHIPVPADSYDIVFSADVLEHVRQPWRWIPELVRVCKPGGFVITIVPANWPYHEDPIDCWRVYPEGLKALYEDACLRDIQCVARYGELTSDAEKSWFPHGGLTIDTIAVGRKP